MEPTPFEKANDFGSNLAASFALHRTLKDLAEAKKAAENNPDATREIEVGSEILFQALIALAGDDIAEA